MAGFERILVPTDFGEVADRALDLALELAAKFEAKVTLLHVFSIPTPAYAEALSWPLDDVERAAREALDALLARTQSRHGEVDAVLDVGVPYDRILERVKTGGFDLVVIGSHGRKGLPRFVIGSVAEKVVRLCPVPVLTVPATHG